MVEESAQDRFVNSSTYSKRKGGARWSKEETEMFYDVRTTSPLSLLVFLIADHSFALFAGHLAILYQL